MLCDGRAPSRSSRREQVVGSTELEPVAYAMKMRAWRQVSRNDALPSDTHPLKHKKRPPPSLSEDERRFSS